MSARTRAKFRCSSVEDFGGTTKSIKLGAVYEGSLGPDEENKRFTVATPTGSIQIQIDNPAAAVIFKPGREYFVEFYEAPVSQYNKAAYED